MDKHTIRILALAALVSLHLLCSATVAQCRIMADAGSEKVKLPNGLCIEKKFPDDCSDTGLCFLCLVIKDGFYATMRECKRECKKPSPLQGVSVAAMATSPPPPPSLPAPNFPA